MTPNEYQTVCERVLTSTMQYVNLEYMRGHDLDRQAVPGDPIYASAVADHAPVTLVFTPAGSGKSKLIADRVAALQASGVAPQAITVLNMNIAKVSQMSAQMPGVNVMTFNDFVHGIFSENMPCIQPSDTDSVIGALWLLDPKDNTKTALLSELIRKMSAKDPAERNVLLTMFVNAHLDFTTDTLSQIKKADSALESMVTQNMMYRFTRDPYEARAILVNGVHNMPLPVLCCVLEYAFMHKCSLFLTGSPQETIYEFSMAYGNAMNSLSAYDGKGLHIIRLTDGNSISPDIKAALDMVPTARIPSSHVSAQHILLEQGEDLEAVLPRALGPGSPYLPNVIMNAEPVLVLARSKSDIACARRVIEEEYRVAAPGLRIADLTAIPAPTAAYGSILGKAYSELRGKYGTISMGALFMELYNILAAKEMETSDLYLARRYAAARNGLKPWAQAHQARFNGLDAKLPLLDAIRLVIDIESEDIQSHMHQMAESPMANISGADVVLSTIHAAVDLRMDHVVLLMHNMNMPNDNGLYRVALSRARKTEHVVFVNRKRTEHPYQRYLKSHIV